MMLFRYYLAQHAEAEGGIGSPDFIQISPEFEEQMLTHDWPGNVREIRSTALRYDAFNGDNSRGDILKPYKTVQESPGDAIHYGQIRGSDPEETLKGKLQSAGSQSSQESSGLQISGTTVQLKDLSSTVELLVIRSLEKQGLTKTEIAQALGISRQGLYKKLKRE